MNITVLTPCLNQMRFLPATMRSVLEQSGAFTLRWQVIDGGSTDGTVDWLREIHDPRLTWTSEADRGQSHAVNKGLARADGDVIGWVNGDDLYEPGALAAVAEAFTRHPEAQWLAGRCRIIDADGREIRRCVTRYKDRRLLRFSFHRLLRENFISQMAVFWRRDFGLAVGPLDESLHYAMDYDLWLRMAGKSPPLILDRALADFRVYPTSKTRGGTRDQFREQYRVACRYMPPGLKGLCLRSAHRRRARHALMAMSLLRLLGR